MDDVLRISDNLDLPLNAVTEAFAIIGRRGSGKTSTAVVMVEEMIHAGLPVIVVDPVGVWWGLRSNSDGTGEGLPAVIFGGDHADLPLHEDAGERLADILMEHRPPAVLDLSGLSKTKARRFMADFAERLYHACREPLHLVLDEADSFAPQRPAQDPAGPRLLGAVDDIVRRGRARGLGVTLITQRPAVLAKDVLSQISTLLVMQLTGVLDVKAVDEWMRLNDTEDQSAVVKASLASLPVGTAWVWSPAWLGILQQIAVRPRRTFDSSATPKVGQRRITPTRMTKIDLAALGEQIAALAEQAAEDDPVQLRAEIAFLRRRLTDRPVEVSVLTDEDRDLLRAYATALSEMGSRVSGLFDRISAARTPLSTPAVEAWSVPAVRPGTNGHSNLPRAQARLLYVLAQNGRSLTARQLAVLSGYSIKSSGFANALSSLRTSGLAVGGRDAISVTDVGRRAAGDVPPLPEGAALVEHWAGQLGKAERTLLRILVDRWPRALSADELAAVSGYSRTSSGFSNAVSRLRSLGLAHGGAAGVAASDELGKAAS